ncbi:MAG: gliding motility-associated C-terminal domain-containing protein [Bacteroidota bacterium]|nr:gliding motility-associated C-terminal domain-containing protein [Bacteroidota bacterium]
MNRILSLILILFSINSLYSQTSNLGRFEVNTIKGCVPLEVEIISENIDSGVTVIQYDFNYSSSSNIFNPSSSNSFIYNTIGTYTIAQAINQDGVEKIDLIEIEAMESKQIELDLFNCLNDNLEILINDNYYDGYNLYVDNLFVKKLNSGSNIFNYSSFFGSDYNVDAYVVGNFEDNDINCSKFDFSISSINNNINTIIDSVILSDDKTNYVLYYKPENSTNYNFVVDDEIDSSFISSSYIYFSDTKVLFQNESFNERCVSVEKYYKCDNQTITDEICIIYLSGYENNQGIYIEFNYENDFDSLAIYRDNIIKKTFYGNINNFTDSYEILKNETYCYKILGYKDNKISKSNSICVTSQDNYNPIPIPTAFTPNDDGLNDEFKPYDSGVSDFKMLIFNKFGEKIFESNDINLGWDGYFNGKIVQGSYVYKMEFVLDSKNVVQTGKFLLIK